MRGWQIGEILTSRRRMRHPMAWRESGAQQVSWDEALAEAAASLARLRSEDPHSIGIVIGDSLSNEEVFAARRFADLLGTPNVASLGLEIDAPAIHGLEETLGAPYRAPQREELDGVDLFVCVNSNLQHINPRAAGAMARHIQQGAARMVLIDEVDQGLAAWAEVYAWHPPGMRAEALRQLAAATAGETQPGPLSGNHLRAVGAALAGSRRLGILASAGALSGLEEGLALGALARALRAEARWVGTYLLPSGANTFGTLDMLAAEGRLPGGMSATRMVRPGRGPRALITIGEDLGRLYGPTELAALREHLEFELALASFSSPMTEAARLVLPVSMAGERAGSIRHADGHVWWSEQVVRPAGEARPIAVVLNALADALGESRQWGEMESIWAAIREQVPGYRHVALEALRRGELPSVGLDAADVASVVDPHALTASGTGPAQTDAEHPFVLVPRSDRAGWITDPRCQAAHLLRREATVLREPYLIMAAADMKQLGVREGGRVQVATAEGTLNMRVRADAGVPLGVTVLPAEFPAVVRALVGNGEAERLGSRPVAGSIEPAEVR
ncbi:MAG: molybdopterin-dependent oxidoreductase [Armatimonadota bacterium]